MSKLNKTACARAWMKLRRDARSIEDIAAWWSQHGDLVNTFCPERVAPPDWTSLHCAASRIANITPASFRRYRGVPRAFSCYEPIPGAAVQFTVPGLTSTDAVTAFPPAAALFFSKPSIQTNSTTLNVGLFAHDWPFLAAQHLFQLQHQDDWRSRKNARELLRFVFPGLTLDAYQQLQSAELLPTDETAFVHWLCAHQGKPDKTRSAHAGAELPMTLTDLEL